MIYEVAFYQLTAVQGVPRTLDRCRTVPEREPEAQCVKGGGRKRDEVLPKDPLGRESVARRERSCDTPGQPAVDKLYDPIIITLYNLKNLSEGMERTYRLHC